MINALIEQILKKSQKAPNKLVAKTPDEDFLPYVCHYDPTTILTKNGELLKIIRITGFSSSTVTSEIISLRETVRDAIKDHVKDNRVAFWFTTIRRKKNISPKGSFDDFFSQEMNEAWVEENKWDDQFVNELYITVIVEGIDTSIVNMASFWRSFSYFATKSLHRNFLSKAHEKLLSITKNIVSETEGYGAKLLGILEWEGVLYSEPMRFFGKISNLCEGRYPLVANDISSDLSSDKIAFGNRELEVISGKDKHYASMLSIKEYFETSTVALDRILQLPFEFIITQSFDFAFTKKELDSYEYQNYILKVSGDEDFRQLSGIADFTESNNGLETDYGKLQTTIMVISRDREMMEQDVKSLLQRFNELGFVAIREDIFMEHCFWSQLPANFRYLRRQKLINTGRIAGFAALHNYPSGSIAGNKWGPAVTVLNTIINTPYFFNFHDHDLGHTLILGPQSSGKTVLLNFLLSQSRKSKPKIFHFDFDNSSKCFISSLKGQYYSFSQDENFYEEFLRINPLSLTKDEENQKFLNRFFTGLLTVDDVPETEIESIPQVVERIFASNIDNLSSAIEAFNSPETKNVYIKLKAISADLNKAFSAEKEVDWSSQTMAFNLSEISDNKILLASVTHYLLYKIESMLDGTPTIIALNDAWKILDDPIKSPRLNDFLNRMKEKNCVVIFVERDFDHISNSDISTVIQRNLATEIFLPNSEVHKCYKDVFGLNEEGGNILQVMNNEERHFLFRHAEDSVIFALDLNPMLEFLRILSADELTIAAMEEVIASRSEINDKSSNIDPKIWLPQLFEVLKEIEKDVIAEEKERLKEERAEIRRKFKASMLD